MDTIRLMQGYWQKPDDAVRKQVEANWSAIEKNAAAIPFALNWGPLRPGTDRMAGLHPDHPNRKWKIKPNPKRPDDLDRN